jgi:hypothetical protein
MDKKYTHYGDVYTFTRLRRTCVKSGNPYSYANCHVRCHSGVSRWHHCKATGNAEGHELFASWSPLRIE